jgi:DNA-binding response OmpR family regulator
MPEKILVVDDDIDTLRLVGLMLQRQGYQIAAANSGQQALAMAESEKPDLILLDVMMPDMDGYEVTRRLRANPAISTIPIIMFTAKSQVDDKVSGFESGADDYLTKPTQPRELFAHIKAVLSRSTKARPAPTATAAVAGNRGHVIGVLAVKGGMGVSTLAVNFAISLRLRTKKEVILAEFRPGEGSLSLDLGYMKPEGMSRLLERKPKEITAAETEAELMTHSSGVRMLLATFQPSDARYTTAVDHFNTMTQCMAYQADYIVLDLGPGIPPITNKVLNSCDELVVLLESNPYTIMRTKVLVDELTQRGFGEGRIIVVLYNRVRSEFQIPVAQVQEQFKHGIAIVFTPAPELIFQASKNNIPLVIQHPDNLTSQQFAKLADNIAKHVRQKT